MNTVRREFVDTSAGQIHVRIAQGPEGNRKPALVCLHHSPSSGFIFAPILARLARHRTVIAPDFQGYGESVKPAQPPEILDYASIMHQAIAQVATGPIDILGYHTGASVAAEWVSLFPGHVRRLMLIGAPLFSAEVRERLLGVRWPGPPVDDGSHLLPEWRKVMENHTLPLSLDAKSAIFHEMFRGGAGAHWGAEAVARHDLPAALGKVGVPTLILETPIYLKGSGAKIQAMIPGSEWKDWQHLGHGMYEAATEEVATEIEMFLDRP